jgi:hypothetical protein
MGIYEGKKARTDMSTFERSNEFPNIYFYHISNLHGDLH